MNQCGYPYGVANANGSESRAGALSPLSLSLPPARSRHLRDASQRPRPPLPSRCQCANRRAGGCAGPCHAPTVAARANPSPRRPPRALSLRAATCQLQPKWFPQPVPPNQANAICGSPAAPNVTSCYDNTQFSNAQVRRRAPRLGTSSARGAWQAAGSKRIHVAAQSRRPEPSPCRVAARAPARPQDTVHDAYIDVETENREDSLSVLFNAFIWSVRRTMPPPNEQTTCAPWQIYSHLDATFV